MNQDLQEPEWAEKRRWWYSQVYIQMEMAKILKYRELIFLEKKNPSLETRKAKTIRCCCGYTIDLLKSNLKSFRILDFPFVNMYYSLMTLEKMPIFSFFPPTRSKQYFEWTNGGYKSFWRGYFFGLDFDGDTIEDAKQDVLKVKKLYDQYKIPHSVNFSVEGKTPVMVKENERILLKEIKDCSHSTMVLSLIEGKADFTPITNFTSHQERLWEIKTEKSTIPLEVTGSHSLIVFDPYKFKILEKETSKIKMTDLLISYRQNKENLTYQTLTWTINKRRYQEILDEPLAWMLGLFVAEGDTHLMTTSFSLHTKEDYISRPLLHLIKARLKEDRSQPSINVILLKAMGIKTKYIIKLIKEVYGLSQGYVEHIISGKLPLPPKINKPYVTIHPSSYCQQIHIASKVWTTFFSKFCGKGAKNKFICGEIFQSPPSVIRCFLNGYLAGDGCLTDEYCITSKTASKSLAIGLMWLYRSIGISSRLSQYPPEKRRIYSSKQKGVFFDGNFSGGYVIGLAKSDFEKRQSKNKYSHEIQLYPTTGLKRLFNILRPGKFLQNRTNQMVRQKRFASKSRILSSIKWMLETKKGKYTQEANEIIKQYNWLFDSEIEFVRLESIKETDNISMVYDFSCESECFFGGYLPILLHNSGSRGFHLVVDYKWLPQLDENKIVTMLGELGTMMKEIDNIPSLDDSIFDSRRVFKLPYSFCMGNIVLPLDDYQIEHFTMQMVQPEWVLKNIKIKNRGMLTRWTDQTEETARESFIDMAKNFIEVDGYLK